MKPPVLHDEIRTGPNRWNLPDKEWLECQYILQEKSMYRIAKDIEADSHTVAGWLRDLGIPIRGHSEAVAQMGIQRRKNKPSGWHNYAAEARRMLQESSIPKRCSCCGTNEGWIDVHHRDGDPTRNTMDNLEYLCRSCHLYEHYARRHGED